jgi:cytochrome oxidase Cu insertion factor (SCO1/SenC/PrrC family)
MFAHTNVVTLVDREGNIRKYFVAAEGDLNFKTVADAVKRLAKEA